MVTVTGWGVDLMYIVASIDASNVFKISFYDFSFQSTKTHTFTLKKNVMWNKSLETRHPTATRPGSVWKIWGFFSFRLITTHVKIPDVKCSPTSKLKYFLWNFASFPENLFKKYGDRWVKNRVMISHTRSQSFIFTRFISVKNHHQIVLRAFQNFSSSQGPSSHGNLRYPPPKSYPPSK